MRDFQLLCQISVEDEPRMTYEEQMTAHERINFHTQPTLSILAIKFDHNLTDASVLKGKVCTAAARKAVKQQRSV